MPEIAFIMGKSASGKDKIYKALMNDDELDLNTIILYTTRPMRVGEVEGVEYHFVDDEFANKMEASNKVVEIRAYNTIYGVWKYFTADDGQIDLASGKKYLVIGTIEAYEQFCKYFGEEHLIPILVEVDDGIRLERALKRERKQEEPKYAEMCRRFLADSEDFSEENIQKANIKRRFFNNDVLEDCINEIKQVIINEM